MKLRRVLGEAGTQVEAMTPNGWVALNRVLNLRDIALQYQVTSNLAEDVVAVLQLGSAGWRALQQEVDSLDANVDQCVTPVLPFEPRSFRDFMLFEGHVIDASRGYVRRFKPGILSITNLYEKITGKPFPKFKPNALWYRQPTYYFGNHLNFLPHQHDINWPSYTKALDYELELGVILAKPLFNATKEQAQQAIGGYVVFNDVSARDIQVDEMQSGFGPQKAKHFINTMAETIITADEIGPDLECLTGTVSINGRSVAHCNMLNMKYSVAEILVFSSRDEQLHPGELFGTGTLPGGSGMENGHWLKHGDHLTLEISGVGKVTNSIVSKGKSV